MCILFHLMTPRPKIPALDAVVQEVEALRSHPGDEIIFTNPMRNPGSLYPERLYGFHRLIYLRRREKTIHLHHVFNAHLRFFPYFRWLQRPMIYSVTAGLRSSEKPEDVTLFKRLSAIVVSNEPDLETLSKWGLENVHLIHPGIDTTRFDTVPPPESASFVLLAGSAPWTKAQFQTKGVQALLAAAVAEPTLRLIFLWRGLLYQEMQERVAHYRLENQVKVLNRKVDVNRVLAEAHAAAVLATDPRLVKAFPHSLMEALAAGRPVLVSRALPMAEYVERTGCGHVVEVVSPSGVLEALDRLRVSYNRCRGIALQVGRRDFSQEALVEAYRRLYSEIRSSPAG